MSDKQEGKLSFPVGSSAVEFRTKTRLGLQTAANESRQAEQAGP